MQGAPRLPLSMAQRETEVGPSFPVRSPFSACSCPSHQKLSLKQGPSVSCSIPTTPTSDEALARSYDPNPSTNIRPLGAPARRPADEAAPSALTPVIAS